MVDFDLMIDKIDLSLGVRQIAMKAIKMGYDLAKSERKVSIAKDKEGDTIQLPWHSVNELPEQNMRIVGLTRVRKRFKHLNFKSEDWWKRVVNGYQIDRWAYVEDLI